MNKWIFGLLLLGTMAGCKNKVKEKDTSSYFPILSYLQGQAKQLDSTLNRITKIEIYADGRSDTSIISRDDIRKYSNQFLDIPNVKDSTDGISYMESRSFDTTMGLVFMSYMAEDLEKEVRKQEITILPSFGGEDLVKTIYVEKSEDGGAVEKKMLWEVDDHFMIRSITQEKNGTERVHTVKISWQDFLR